MRICIVSDSHDNRYLLKAAVADAIKRGAECVLHCGDIVAPTTLRSLISLDIPVHAIHGNNTGDLHSMSMLACDPANKIHYHGQDADFSLADKRIFLVHYPHYAQAMALTGNYDLICCGHDHRTTIETIDTIKGSQTTLVNPGTVGGVGAVPTYIMGDLTTMEFEIVEVPIDPELAYNRPPVTEHN